MASPLEPDNVPKELECAICFSIPQDPRILRHCSHVFCKDCILQSLSHRSVCPVCQRQCSRNQALLLKDGSKIAHRIWSNIAYKCEYHGHGCTWKGSISDYKSHKEACPGSELSRKLQSLENENKRLATITRDLKRRNRDYRRLLSENNKLKSAVEKLEGDKQKLQETMQDMDEKAEQRLLETHSDWERETNLLQEKIFSIRNSEKALKKENAKLKKQSGGNQPLERKNKKLTVEKEKLENLLNTNKESSRKEIGSLKRKNRKLESSIRLLEHQKKDYPRLERENRKIKREKNSLLNDMKTMAGIKRSLSAHLNDEKR